MLYLWLIENLKQKDASKVTSTIFFFDALTLFNASIYFRFISKNWRYWFGYPEIIHIAAAFAFILQNDSPGFYYGVGKYDQARKVLTAIGRRNKVLTRNQDYTKVFKKEQESLDNPEDEDKKEKLSAWEFYKVSLNRRNQFIFVVMSIGCSFSYYLINFYLRYLPGDIYTNYMVSSVSEAFSYLGAMLVVLVVTPRMGYALSFFACLFSSCLVLLAEYNDYGWLIPFAVLLAKSSISVAFCLLYFTI